ncbi:DUF349 domain-containing protein [Fluviicola sp.]|jgi:hypothetical protein|uniref:DUF349 domain-containing protein n=1 Tax=Fluviicola sp. TaxID=1917219 RepID=UPI00282148EF|nr:DUF349 domain-containing protein [Fluviicola sp.]MDR0801366.1 DUF349 domain-containing protein [Fluviicola sp.]
MEKASLLESLKNLAQQEDALSVAREVGELRNQFEDVILEEDRQFQVKQLEAREQGEPVEERVSDPVREEFYRLYNAFRDRKSGQQRVKKEAEEAHLRRKKALLERLREVIEKEENIGAAMTAYKEIHDEWKEVGDIPREKRQDIQSEYSRLLETFFYHIKIYRELREHDLHRNHQLKLDVIRRIQELSAISQVKDVEQAIKTLQNEWDETGPVSNDAWESLKNSYWDAVRAVYARIQSFYDEKRGELASNLEQKKEIAQRAVDLVKDFVSSSTKDWDTATATLLALQEEWKKIGFGPRKENEEVWKEFRAACDEFFAKKKVFFDSLRGKFDDIASKKQVLIDKLEEIKNSTEWKKTTDQILLIQKEWKNLGSAGQRFEQKLWKEFRAACDHFFDSKQAHFSSKDKEFEENLMKKMELIDRIKATAIPEDKKEALTLLKGFAAEFNEIGHVPMKEKDRVFNAYKEALNSHYQKLKLEGEEQEKMLFQARLDTLKADPNSERSLARERYDLNEKINKLKSDILQFENNLGFFAKSEGADLLKKEVESKIAAAQRKIDELRAKIKMIQ